MPLPRRAFLESTLAAGLALGGLTALQRRHGPLQDPGYGPLVPAGDDLALPEGFQYRTLGVERTPMSDGIATPAMHDGMAAFPLDGHVALVRNHEITSHQRFGPEATAYDAQGGGGTTTLLVHPDTRDLVTAHVSLNGTITNCAGGPTPWGTWISCEEHAFGITEGFGQDHGYAFEVPVAARHGGARAEPLRAMGRFKHEAVAVDPDSGIVYQTEDFNPTAGFYRFVPDVPGSLARGGRLEMLAVRHRDGYDTRRGQRVGPRLPVTWVPIANPDPADAGRNFTAVFQQGHAAGGAVFSRLEGCWWGDGAVYFDATNGGDAGLGQIWRYRPSDDTLDLVFESPSRAVLSNPDNLCWSPRGGLVVCEDTRGTCYLRGITREGRLFDFARNIADASEFAGATFSPDGRTLFVNTQGNGQGVLGKTFAIWGPWERGSL